MVGILLKTGSRRIIETHEITGRRLEHKWPASVHRVCIRDEARMEFGFRFANAESKIQKMN